MTTDITGRPSRIIAPGGPVSRAVAAMRHEPEPPRRGFLRGLLALPLLGGAVTLIGAPTAVAEPVTAALLDSYDAWLFYERWKVLREKHGGRCDPPDFGPIHTLDGGRGDFIPAANGGYRWQQSEGRESPPSSRAALVLSTVGCDWREGGL